MKEKITEKLGGELGNLALSNITEYAITFGKNLIAAVLVYVIGKFIIGKLLGIIRKIMRKKQVETSLFTFLDSTCSIALYFLLVIAVVATLGIETSSFVALFASAGVAIGMALSGSLQNFAGGVMILIFHPFRVGDYIEAQGFGGIVKYIQIFSTVIVTPDNQTIFIPNGGLSTGTIKNVSREPVRRIDIDINVAYGTKPEEVRRVVMPICDADDRISKEAPHSAVLPMTAMADSSITFQLRVWADSSLYWDVRFDTTEKVYTALTEAGISIPFPQLDVHMVQPKA